MNVINSKKCWVPSSCYLLHYVFFLNLDQVNGLHGGIYVEGQTFTFKDIFF